MNYGNQGKCVSTPNDTSSWTPVKDMWVYCDKNTYNGIRENPTQITKIDSRNIWCKDIRGESYLSADRFKSQYRPAFPHEIPQQEVLPSSATSNKRVEDLKYMDVVHIETEEEYNRVCKLNKIISEYKSGFKYYLMKGSGGKAEKRISYENCGYTIYEMNQLIFNEVKSVEVDMNAIQAEAKLRYPVGTRYNCVNFSCSNQLVVKDDILYSIFGNEIFGSFLCGCLYANGKWAEIVSLSQTKDPVIQKLEEITKDWEPNVTKFRSANGVPNFVFTGIGEIRKQDRWVYDVSGTGILYMNGSYAQKVEEEVISITTTAGDTVINTGIDLNIGYVRNGGTITLSNSWFDDDNTNKIRTWKEYGDMFSKYYVGTDPVNIGLGCTNKLTKAAQKKSISLDTKDYDSKSINQELKLKKVNKQKSTIKFY